MTRYAYDPAAHAITASWPHAAGHDSTVGFALPAALDLAGAHAVGRGLHAAAAGLWAGYCTPAGDDPDGALGVAPAWLGFVTDGLPTMLCHPGAFDTAACYAGLSAARAARGAPIVRLGWLLAAGDGPLGGLDATGRTRVLAGVVAELAAELDAVRTAYTGVLTGRATQASVLLRPALTGAGHPEAVAALRAALDGADRFGCAVEPLTAVPGELAAVHALGWLEGALASGMPGTDHSIGRDAVDRVLAARAGGADRLASVLLTVEPTGVGTPVRVGGLVTALLDAVLAVERTLATRGVVLDRAVLAGTLTGAVEVAS